MSLYLSGLRHEYRRSRLRKENADPDPINVFTAWLDDAVQAQLHEPNAMTLATATPDGRPSARLVLLKGVDPRGFIFFTNYESRKGRELAANAHAALTFWWGPLERQVRVEGRAQQLDSTESDAYYDSRPLGSRLGAWVSAQSTIIENRDLLEEKLVELQAEYADKEPRRPPFWGGYLVVPDVIEFWQGGLHRLHDRLRYARQDDGTWKIVRLSP
ncbi:MAG: pyridoxamine 5'-phosphate oxidase [Caldilineaceae bacterium]|nr:pyridoxamine 5'-phosphate oxidase [Caldilineaceae bacterium]